MSDGSSKAYDRDYFDRWYRNPKFRVAGRRVVARRAALAVAAAEVLLERPVGSVLDVGCGEGAFRAALKALRPRARYLGVDPSAYAVARYGRTRNLRRLGFSDLDELPSRPGFDLVVCADVLHYLEDAEIEAGLPALAALAAGVAYMPLFAAGDRFWGDRQEWRDRPPSWYLERFRGAGLVPLGLHLYAGPALSPVLASLEAGAALPRG